MGGKIVNRYNRDTITRNVEVDPATGCWNWTAYVQSGGYGQLQVCGRRILAHRLSWIVYHDEQEPVAYVLHRCDNRRCVNPEHLFDGDAKANHDDMVAKGRDRQWPGDARTKPRVRSLTHAQVLEIAQSTGSLADTAALYGCAQSTVSRIRNGTSKSKLTGIAHSSRVDGRKLQLNRRSQLPLTDRIAARRTG